MTNRPHSKFRSQLTKLLLSTSFLAGSLTLGAQAQTAESDDETSTRTLGTVTVTARKKEESLQDVPVAVAAVSGEAIEQYGLDSVDEIATRIPNIKIQASGAGQGGGIFFRGIGSNPNAGAFESSLAVNVDGAVVSTPRIVQNSFFDLESFELLKGPQALYFGKAATAGVLSLRTKNPTDEFELSGSLAYEFEQESIIGEGIVSGPITDNLLGRLAIRSKDTKVVNENLALGVANPERGEESTDVRATIVWEPTDSLDFTVKYTDLSYENDGANLNNRPVIRSIISPGSDKPAAPANLGTPGQTGGYTVPLSGNQVGIPDVPQVANDPASIYFRNGVPYSENDTSIFNLKAAYDINDDYRLVGTFAQTDIEDTGFDNYAADYTAGGSSASLVKWDIKTYELRLEADPTEKFSFMLGGFIEDSNQFFDAEQYSGFAAVGRLAAGVEATTPGFEGAFYDVRKVHNTDSEISSIFGSFDFDITDRLSLSAGARYTDVSREGTIDVLYLHDFLIDLGTVPAYSQILAGAFGLDPNAPAFPGAPFTNAQAFQGLFGGAADTRNGTFSTPTVNYDEEDTNIEVTLNYEFVDNQSVYVAYKEAFKPGGIDNAIVAWNSDIPSITAAGENVIFDGEKVDGFEIGYKGELLNRTLRLNGVFYNFDYTDFQIQSFNPASVSFQLANAGEVKSQGVEVDFEYLPPVDGLSVYGAFAWDNSEFESFTDPVTSHILDGRQLNVLPEFSGVAGFTYENNFGNTEWTYNVGYNIQFSGDYLVGQQYNGFCNGLCQGEALVDFTQEGFSTHDLSFGITSPDERWSMDLIANNIGDEIYAVSGNGVGPGAIDDATEFFNEGRTVTLRLGAKF